MSHYSFRILLFVVGIAAVLVACGGQKAAPATAIVPTETAAPPTAVTAPASDAPDSTSAAPSALADKAFATLKELTEDYSPRESATEQELEASQYLLARLRELGYSTSVQEFSVTRHGTRLELPSQIADVSDSVEAFTVERSPKGCRHRFAC